MHKNRRSESGIATRASVGTALLYENRKLCDLLEIGKFPVSQQAPVLTALVIQHVNVFVILVVKVEQADSRAFMGHMSAHLVSHPAKLLREGRRDFLRISTDMVLPGGSRAIEYRLSPIRQNTLRMAHDVGVFDRCPHLCRIAPVSRHRPKHKFIEVMDEPGIGVVSLARYQARFFG